MSEQLWGMLFVSLWQTIYMVAASLILATIAGVPIGILLVTTERKGLWENILSNKVIAAIVNAVRSIPFIILLIAIIPLTQLIVGTSIGTTAAIVPLTLSAIPFIARIVESAIKEVDPGLIEAGNAMGASNWQIIRKIFIPESMPGIIRGLTITLINLVGYSAMAGAVGGGGLGDLAIRYGYERFNVQVMLATIVVLIILVQLCQVIGDYLAAKYSHV